MSAIEELYLKNSDKLKTDSKEYIASKKLCEIENELRSLLNNEQQSVFNKYLEYENELENIIACENFTAGFKLSAQILIEALANDN